MEFRKIINLSNEDIYDMAIKGAASWSLASNAQQHEGIFEICNEEIKVRPQSSKIYLLRIVAYTYGLKNNYPAAMQALKELISLVPNDKNVHNTLGMLYVELGDLENARKELEILIQLDKTLAMSLEKEIRYRELKVLSADNLTKDSDLPNPEETVNKIITAIDDIKSFQSRFILRNYSNEKLKSKDYVFIEWRLGYEKPGRFSVEQYANENEHSVYDMWISIGDKHFQLVPVMGWMEEKEAELIKNKNQANYDISLEKYANLMKQNKPDLINLYEDQNNKGYFIIKYNSPKWDFYKYEGVGNSQYNVEIWADKSTFLLTRAVIKMDCQVLKSKENFSYDLVQLFTNYNNVAIQQPTKIWRDKNSEFMTPEELQETTGKW